MPGPRWPRRRRPYHRGGDTSPRPGRSHRTADEGGGVDLDGREALRARSNRARRAYHRLERRCAEQLEGRRIRVRDDAPYEHEVSRPARAVELPERRHHGAGLGGHDPRRVTRGARPRAAQVSIGAFCAWARSLLRYAGSPAPPPCPVAALGLLLHELPRSAHVARAREAPHARSSGRRGAGGEPGATVPRGTLETGAIARVRDVRPRLGRTSGARGGRARLDPGIVGMSMTFQFRARNSARSPRRCVRPGSAGTSPSGGHFPTFAWREVLDELPRHRHRRPARGRGDPARALRRARAREHLAASAGLAFRDEGGVRLQPPAPPHRGSRRAPFPKRVGAPQIHLGIPAAFLVGSRGCYGHCTFCCIHAYLKSAGGPSYRLRSASRTSPTRWPSCAARAARACSSSTTTTSSRATPTATCVRVTALRDALKSAASTTSLWS